MSILTDRVIFSGSPAGNDLIHIVDVSDPTDNPAGTSFAIEVSGLTSGGAGAFTSTTVNNTIIPTIPFSNTVNSGSTNSSILGGTGNTISDSERSFIGGGYSNQIVGYSYGGANVIVGGGSSYNNASNTISGGSNNFIGGGAYNTNNIISGSSYNNAIVAGEGNIIDSNADSFIGGGNGNQIRQRWASIVGGQSNTILESHDFIGGGSNNTINAFTHSSILGGQSNTVNHQNAHIIGSNITSIEANTTFVNGFNIGTIGSGTPQINLGLDSSGNVVTGTTGGGGVTIDPYEDVGNVTSITWDVSGTSTNYEATLTGVTTLTMSNVRNGDYGTLIVTQDGTGSHTLSFDGGPHKVVNGGGGAPTLTTNGGGVDILSFTYNGSTFYWTVGNDYT